MQAEAEPPQEADTVEDQNNSLVAPLPSEAGELPAPDAAAPLQHQQGALVRYPTMSELLPSTRRDDAVGCIPLKSPTAMLA